MRSSLGFLLALLLAILPNLRVVPISHAQSATDKPQLKEFGSSLKRLKWDPVRQSTTEIRDPSKPKSSGDLDVIRTQTDLVSFDIQVRDPQGRLVTGLTRDDFMVTEEGDVQRVSHFSLGDDLTIARSIVLIIDYSGSLLGYINRSIDAAKILVDKLSPKDRMAIVTDDVQLITEFTSDKQKLKKALESVRQRVKAQQLGRSFQFTALMATVRELFDAEDIRPIVIFQTDGDEVSLLQPPDLQFYFVPEVPANAPDAIKESLKKRQNTSADYIQSMVKPFSLRDVYDAVEKSRATVYTIIPGYNMIGATTENQIAIAKATILSSWYSEEQLRNIARHQLGAQKAAAGAALISGGWTAFLNKPEQAADIYSSILSDINSRYMIGYYPTNKNHDGKRRSVSVEVRGHPDYVLSRRRSYYALEPEP